MRRRSLLLVTTCVVPTAPIVSGGMGVPLRNSPLKVFVGPGEGPVADAGGALGEGSSPTEVRPPLGGVIVLKWCSGLSPFGGLIDLISEGTSCDGSSASCLARARKFTGGAPPVISV